MQAEWSNELAKSFTALGLDFQPVMPPSQLTEDIHAIANTVPEFAKADLRTPEAFSLYRTMLYNAVRAIRPALMFETGILNGFSSAFILQAMEDNGQGRLISIDLPHNAGDFNGEYEEQGTTLLPKGKKPGWSIPERLRARHAMHFGRAEILLPQLLDSEGIPEIFLHDSDHRYPHMMMEISMAWSRMTEGLIMADNVEQNRAFLDFSEGVSGRHSIVSSYNSPERLWQHGLLRK